jgi:phosphate transport system substrate-binding protein
VGLAFREGVKALKVNGMEATPETVLAKTYPIARPLYMYTNGRPAQDSPLCNFVNLSDTPEGKKIVEDTGFVPLK